MDNYPHYPEKKYYWLLLTRAANEVANFVTKQRQYTDWELRAAIVASFEKTMTRPTIRRDPQK